jgi:hypothetical protein
LVEDVRFRGGVMVQKSFSLKWSNVCSFTLGRFDEVEECFVVWSGFIFTEHGVNVVVICLSAFVLDNFF